MGRVNMFLMRHKLPSFENDLQRAFDIFSLSNRWWFHCWMMIPLLDGDSILFSSKCHTNNGVWNTGLYCKFKRCSKTRNCLSYNSWQFYLFQNHPEDVLSLEKQNKLGTQITKKLRLWQSLIPTTHPKKMINRSEMN